MTTPTIPTEDCQSFYIKCQSSNTYISRGNWHEVNTYTTLGDTTNALKFIRFQVGAAQSKSFIGRYVLMDEDGNFFSFNSQPQPGSGHGYSFALRLPWAKGDSNIYQIFEMGSVDGKSYNNIKVYGQNFCASRFIGGSYENQINLMPVNNSAQNEYVLEPIQGTNFNIPIPIHPKDVPNPTPPTLSTNPIIVSQAVIPRFMVDNAQLTDNNPLNNPYYLLSVYHSWKTIYKHTNLNDTPENYTYTVTQGVDKSVATTTEQEISINLTASVEGNLKGIGISVSASVSKSWGWSKTLTTGWNEQTSFEVEGTIPAQKSLYLYQKFSLLQINPLNNPQELTPIAPVPLMDTLSIPYPP